MVVWRVRNLWQRFERYSALLVNPTLNFTSINSQFTLIKSQTLLRRVICQKQLFAIRGNDKKVLNNFMRNFHFRIKFLTFEKLLSGRNIFEATSNVQQQAMLGNNLEITKYITARNQSSAFRYAKYSFIASAKSHRL